MCVWKFAYCTFSKMLSRWWGWKLIWSWGEEGKNQGSVIISKNHEAQEREKMGLPCLLVLISKWSQEGRGLLMVLFIVLCWVALFYVSTAHFGLLLGCKTQYILFHRLTYEYDYCIYKDQCSEWITGSFCSCLYLAFLCCTGWKVEEAPIHASKAKGVKKSKNGSK